MADLRVKHLLARVVGFFGQQQIDITGDVPPWTQTPQALTLQTGCVGLMTDCSDLHAKLAWTALSTLQSLINKAYQQCLAKM